MPQKEKSEKEVIQDLRNENRKLVKENKRLKSELKTVEAAMNKTHDFLKDDLKNTSLERLIKGANNNETKKDIKIELTKEDVRLKWKRWRDERFGRED